MTAFLVDSAPILFLFAALAFGAEWLDRRDRNRQRDVRRHRLRERTWAEIDTLPPR
jgi:hypothetical protein